MHLSLLLSCLISCASVKEIDRPLCVEINLSKAFCTYTISNKDFYVDDEHPYAFDPKYPDKLQTWFEVRPAMVLMPVQTWAAFKKYIIKNCKLTKKCDGMIEGWDRTMNVLDQNLELKGVEVAPTLP